ncbi:MAG: tetratricopeptide repeat protein [Deltaproteobacteria bacterium]|nr:tetratricopeptide repeat protein [Deltaproteobacteria bacterium]
MPTTISRIAFIALCLTFASPAISVADQDVSGLYRDSFALESAGNLKAATNKVLMILRKEPDSYFANLRTGWLFYCQGKSEEAVRYYDRSVGLKPKAVEPLLGKMLPLLGMAAWGKVIQTANKAIELDPGNYTANSKLAYALFMSGNYAKALERYEFTSERFPGDLEMSSGAAWCKLKMGRTAKARTIFVGILKISPSNLSALRGLAACKLPAPSPQLP